MRAVIVSADNFEDTELLVPYYRLKEGNVEVDVASLRRGPVKGMHGYTVDANRFVDEVAADRYDILLLPGGRAPASLRKNQRVLQLTRAFFSAGKPVGAICHGPQILVSAGVMKGRTATAYKEVQPELKEAGANVKDEELVVDGNLFTSRQPGDLPAFNREMMHRLGNR